MKVNQLKWGSALSYGQMALSVIINIVFTPMMIHLLGKNEYGLYNTVSSTISMLSILSLGFGSGYIRYYAKYKLRGEQEKIFRLNGMFLLIFTVIGVVALGCGLFLAFHLELVFDSGLTQGEYATARTLMLLLTVNLAVSFPMSVMTNIVTANERYVFAKLVNMIKTVLGPMVMLPVLLLGFRSVGIVVSTLVLSLIADGITSYYVLCRLKNRFWFSDFEKGLFRGLFGYTVFIALNLIIDQVNLNIDKLLLARYRGTGEVAVYSVGYNLYVFYAMASSAVSSVFTPRIHAIVNKTQGDLPLQKKQLTDLFIRVGRIQFLLLGLVGSGLVFFGKPFITNFWAGPEYGDSYAVALLLTLPASIALVQNLGIEIQRAKNLHRFRAVAYTIMAAVNLLLSIYLCQRYGAIGSAVGTAISLILANGLIMNIYYHKKCNIDILAFWRAIFPLIVGLAIPAIFGLVLQKVLDFDRIWMLLLGIGLYTGVYCLSQWFIGMNPYEKGLILSPFGKIRNRGNKSDTNQ